MLYNLEPGRDPEQIRNMQELEAKGLCIFCTEGFKAWHREPILLESEHWFVTANDFPYAETDAHLLIVPRAHVTTVSELERGALVELGPLIAQIELEWQLQHFAFGLRSGDFNYNGSTVEHLHGHIIVAKKNPQQKVRFAVSRSPENETPP